MQGHKDGLEASALVLLQTCLGLAAALGCAAWGVVTARPSAQCLVSRQYLCQAALLGVGQYTSRCACVHPCECARTCVDACQAALQAGSTPNGRGKLSGFRACLLREYFSESLLFKHSIFGEASGSTGDLTVSDRSGAAKIQHR